MMRETNKISSFTDLEVWKVGHQLVIEIYRVTKDFPSSEQFGLTNQIRRASVSITSNISEGFSRNSYKDKVHFYRIALGSLTEVQNQLLIAKDVGYISKENFDRIVPIAIQASKLCNGLIKKSKLYYS